MAPGRSRRHCTGCGWPVTEFSNTGALKSCSEGNLPPVTSATAQSIAKRTLSLPVATVNSLKSGFSLWLSIQKQPRELPSEVASAGIERLNFLNTGSAPTKDGPMSDTITSIFGFFEISAVRTCWVRDGSQLVTSNGAGFRNLYLSSSTDFSPASSSKPWLFPAGPLRKSRLPPLGRMLLIQRPQLTPSSLNEEPMNLV